MDTKRILAIVGFVLLTTFLGWAVYRVFFYTAPEPVYFEPSEESPIGGGFPASEVSGDRAIEEEPSDLPTAPVVDEAIDGIIGVDAEIEPERITRRLDDNILGARVGTDKRLQYYNEADGKFYKISQSGEVEQLSDQVFFNVQEVQWSPTKNEAIIEYPDGANIYYDFDTGKQATLPRHWEEFSFSPEGGSIAAKSLGVSEENRWIVATDPDGRNIELIEPMGANADKVQIDWSPNQQIIGTTRTGDPLGADREEILFIGRHGENFRSITVEGRGFQSEWSTTGNKLLYSVFSARSDFKPELWIVDGTPQTLGQNRNGLRVNTWADKCSFQDDRYVYCGVPEELPTGAGFAPDIANQTRDRLVRIDTQTGAQTEISLGRDSFHVIDKIYVDEESGILRFTDKNYNGLFDVEL